MIWVVGGIGAAVFAVANAPTLRSVIGAVGRISPGFALAGLALSGLAILNRAGLNRAAHNVVGLPAEPMSMIRPAAGFAANKILRCGGVAGAAMFVRHGDTRLYRRGAVVGARALASLASLTALGLLLATSIAVLAARGALTGWWTAAAIGFTAGPCRARHRPLRSTTSPTLSLRRGGSPGGRSAPCPTPSATRPSAPPCCCAP